MSHIEFLQKEAIQLRQRFISIPDLEFPNNELQVCVVIVGLSLLSVIGCRVLV